MPKCEICGKSDFSLIATEIREGTGKIIKCKQCDLVIQDLNCTNEEIEDYYNEQYQLTNSLDAGRKQTSLEHFESRTKTMQPVIDRISNYLRNDMKVLDVGCGTGELLNAINSKVNEVIGIELNKDFVEFINKELNIKAYSKDISDIDFGKKKFDLIISIATLDHLQTPLKTLARIKDLLSHRGMAYIEVPNLSEALNFYLPDENRKAFNKFFWHKAHFFYFTRETLLKLMEKAGFVCNMTCRHEYTLCNYLNWYFKGSPQQAFVEAATGIGLFGGNSEFEKEMNEMFYDMENRFHKLMEKTFYGDTLCCLAKPKKR